MMSQMVTSESRSVQKLLEYVTKNFPITTIILFGSRARRKVDLCSDIDLLVIFDSARINEEELPLGHKLRDLIPENVFPKDKPLSFSVYSTEGFACSYRRGSLFILHIINEGTVLFDLGFYNTLRKSNFRLSDSELKGTLQMLSDRLDITNDLRKFNSYFIRTYTIFYSILRTLSFVASASKDKPVFDRNQAIALFMELYPKRKAMIQQLASLRPFYLRNITGADVALPFAPDSVDNVIYFRDHLREMLVEVMTDVES